MLHSCRLSAFPGDFAHQPVPHGEEAQSAVSNHEAPGCGLTLRDAAHAAPQGEGLLRSIAAAHTGLSEPVLPFGSWIEVQVPPCTNFHALPWKSVVEVPWQVVPGPAAQSFWPFRATPKHFSFLAATAASASALVKGPAAAMVASAVLTAPARTNELIT